MCGRKYVKGPEVEYEVSERFGIDFTVQTNLDLRPTQTLSTVVQLEDNFTQLDTRWGIKPTWLKRLLINGRSETITTKPVFKRAIHSGRCLIPCSGWFEWRDDGKPKKTRYLFTPSSCHTVYIAGIVYFKEAAIAAGIPFEDHSPIQSVSLTTRPNQRCAAFHDRMPVVIEPEHVHHWLEAPTDELAPFFEPVEDGFIDVKAA